MRRLFASWRMKYVSSNQKQPGCVFCASAMDPLSKDKLVVFIGEYSIIMLNKYPYTSGHLMVAPKQHASKLSDLQQETRIEIMELITKSVSILSGIYKPEGFNIGANLGEAAGAGIPDHLHFHIVPRWNGDTNFMTSVGETRVLPEDLYQTYQKVKTVFQNSKG